MRLIWLTTLLAPSVAFAGYEVSSYKKETKMGANFWNASAAIDDDLGTCWMVDPEGENENQWIEIGVPAGNVDKIALITGWAKDEATFKDYARVKSGRIEVYQGDTTDILLEPPVKFEDTPGWQLVDIPDTKVAGEIEGGRVRLVVTAVYSEGGFGRVRIPSAYEGICRAGNFRHEHQPQ